MNETLHRFGPDSRLCGVLHTPSAAVKANATAVIFITAGLIHKTGPFRLYVELGRTLATHGIPSLRFDLSGIGESANCESGESAEQSAVTDVRAAMDALGEELGVTRFVLAGLCSGAEVAHRTAVSDERVQGFIAMDGYIMRTPAYYFWHYLPRVFSLRKWLDFARSKLSRLGSRGNQGADAPDEDEALAFWEGPGPSREKLSEEFRLLCNRRVRQLQVFSGGSGDYSYQRQFQDAFRDVDFADLLDVRYLRETDHVYVLQADRRKLMQLITEWLTENFSVQPQHSPAGTRLQQAQAFATSPMMSSLARPLRTTHLSNRRNTE